LYVLFSSGTTGLPKCITHSAGGTLLNRTLQFVETRRLLCSDIRNRAVLELGPRDAVPGAVEHHGPEEHHHHPRRAIGRQQLPFKSC
jgi:hypothetical protein